MPEPINDFFEVSFNTQDEATHFSFQVLNLADSERGAQLSAGTRRLIAFQPLMPEERSNAYVSAGAAQMLMQSGARYPISNQPIALRDLPDALALVVGDQIDYMAYEARRRT